MHIRFLRMCIKNSWFWNRYEIIKRSGTKNATSFKDLKFLSCDHIIKYLKFCKKDIAITDLGWYLDYSSLVIFSN